MNQPTFRDAEVISAYLDKQLSQAESARLVERMKTDAALRAVFNDMSQSRSTLRRLPMRRAPRNFRLTPGMAGIKPPLPRAFPVFRLISAFASVLFFIIYAANLSTPALAIMRAAAPAPGYGMGGGGDVAAMQAPAPEAAAPAEGLGGGDAAAATPAAGIENFAPGAQPKLMNPNDRSQTQAQTVPIQMPVSAGWQFALLGLAVISGAGAFFVRARNERAWFAARAVRPAQPAAGELVLAALALLLVLALAFSIYWAATTPFYAPVAQNLPALAGDKGPQILDGQTSFALMLGQPFSFWGADPAGDETNFEFPAGLFASEMQITYMPGLDVPAPAALYYPTRAFRLSAADASAVPLGAYSLNLGYASLVGPDLPEAELRLLWWSGSEWVDAAESCSPASSYERLPELKRLRVDVCQLGNFVLSAP